MRHLKNLRSDVVYGVLAFLVIAAGVGAALRFRQTLSPAGPISVAAAPSTPQEGEGLQRYAVPRPIADIGFIDDKGVARKLSDWRGKTVLVNLWAMWCAPCKLELPALDRLQLRLGSEHFAILALDTDRAGLKAAKDFFQKSHLEHLTLLGDDTAEANIALKVEGLPTSLILNEQGLEVARILGPMTWDDPQTVEKIKGLMEH